MPSEEKAKKVLPPSKSVPLIVKAMKAINQEDIWFDLGPIGNKLKAANSDFDTRSYGCEKLSELVKKAGQFEVEEIEGRLKVRSNNA